MSARQPTPTRRLAGLPKLGLFGRLLPTLAAIAVVTTLSGCTTAVKSTSTHAAAPATASDTPSTAASPTASCGDATASLRPTGALPPAGAMPAGSFMAGIVARGHLTVGTSQDTLLFSARNPLTGVIEGFDIDIAHQIAQAIFGDPAKVKLVVIPNAGRVSAVQNGTVDIVAETMTINCERRASVDFSSVYYQAGQRLLVPLTSTATGLQSLTGKKVCAAAGSTSLAAITAAANKPVAVTAATWGECLVLFQQNKVDAISTDDTILAGLAAQDPYAKLVGPAFTAEPYGLAISTTHPDFTGFVNGVLEHIRADGTWATIYARWLAKFGATPAPPVATYRN